MLPLLQITPLILVVKHRKQKPQLRQHSLYHFALLSAGCFFFFLSVKERKNIASLSSDPSTQALMSSLPVCSKNQHLQSSAVSPRQKNQDRQKCLPHFFFSFLFFFPSILSPRSMINLTAPTKKHCHYQFPRSSSWNSLILVFKDLLLFGHYFCQRTFSHSAQTDDAWNERLADIKRCLSN